ncbi:MAG TPA: hypothetical protein VGN35_06450 [Jatrophihabitantaceae bacterium]|nr:hypothetical protein [Jatrophihabitantaceae bacterium]
MIEPSALPATPGVLPPGGEQSRRPQSGTLQIAAVVVAALAVLGVLLGLVWIWWSPPRPVGFVVAPHAVQPDETEAFAAGDGRFAALTALAGVGGAIVVWYIRRLRGPLAVIALGLGGLIGAWLTEAIGHALGGGSSTGGTQTLITHLPLQLHMGGLRLIEAAIAVLGYGLFVAFAASDDLDVDDPQSHSVRLGGQPQDGWGHRDAPGALQQPNLASEQPHGQM